MELIKMTKLYLTLEDGAIKVERVVQLTEERYHPRLLEIIEDMQDTIDERRKDSHKYFELINEGKRLTINQD